MAQTTVSIRMDETVKKQFDAFCNEIGMNTSVAVNLFAKAVLREQRIPFELSLNVPNADTIAAIREGGEIIADGKGRFTTSKEMFNDLGI